MTPAQLELVLKGVTNVIASDVKRMAAETYYSLIGRVPPPPLDSYIVQSKPPRIRLVSGNPLVLQSLHSRYRSLEFVANLPIQYYLDSLLRDVETLHTFIGVGQDVYMASRCIRRLYELKGLSESLRSTNRRLTRIRFLSRRVKAEAWFQYQVTAPQTTRIDARMRDMMQWKPRTLNF